MPANQTAIRLQFKCANLVNKDLLGKSDPFIIVDLQEGVGKYTRIGCTEVIKDNINPVFEKKVELEYIFEKKQRLRLTVIDVDDFDKPPTEYHPNMEAGDLLGTAEVTLSEIMGARSWTVTKELSAQIKNKNYGTVTIQGLRLDDSVRPDDELAFKLSGLTLAAKDTMQFTPSSDPFFHLFRKLPDMKKMCGSEVIKQNLEPEWKEQRVNFSELCGGDISQAVRIEVFDEDLTKIDPIGNAEVAVEKLLKHEAIQLIDHKNRPDKQPGKVKVRESIIYRTPNFYDYMADNGVEVQLVVAVDFTDSNIKPTEPGSFHLLSTSGEGLTEAAAVPQTLVVRGPNWSSDDVDGGAGGLGTVLSSEGDGWVRVEWSRTGKVCSHKVGKDGELELCEYKPNRYQRSLIDFASQLVPLDTDRTIKAFGFGARLPGEDKDNQSFPLNIETKDSDARELKGLLEAYETAQKGVTLGVQGTFAAPVINRVVAMAKETVKSKPKKFYILLILTDGDINDEADTTDAVVAASDLPITIITAGLARKGTDEQFELWRRVAEGALKLKDKDQKIMLRETVRFLRLEEQDDATASFQSAMSAFHTQLLRHFQLKNVRPTIWEKDTLYNYHILANKPPQEK
mmetsp:Transcript_60509/g.161332  ORF Transcript_60509/g.161332 Transcript_60509/m.161332 type:complete len:625 (+) Transcript_60509:40-1914(+)